MLDTDTKRRIDTARDILVGKVPDPKSQVEQITIALIYKFMDDMDAESEELGGKRKFFTGEFARYGWAKLMDRSLGGHEMLGLYGEGISKMPENPGIPPLFRDIFKNAYLPYRDPETLKAFLKIIDEFSYDHSERLGDAFEYLLSVLGSQGDAGQFRTPRHIIDFMVEVVAPQKGETVLDPACGTAGFLISAWKYVLKHNTSPPKPSPLCCAPSPLPPLPEGEGKHSSLAAISKGEGRNFRGGFDFSGLKDRARELRKKQTNAEALLWELLRDRQLCDAKFRRQHQFGEYICDFYCDVAKLAVECDGEVHDSPEQKKHDQKRDAYLKSQGLTVLRFPNQRILQDPDSVLNEIAAHFHPSPPGGTPSHALHPSPPGRGAGGEGAQPRAGGEGRQMGDLLTPDERGRLAKNFTGYDISPDMVRLSLVNLYLHGFADPHVYEYDTLTSEERWNEYADVILANPPFMSPKGGIKPHKRFSIQAKRSEVLFVDYMAEHLTPSGRAAIIVPEGIIFQSQTAYKELRKMLVENALVAVVSLPAGCFNPYSGVKTSILILDKSLARQSDAIAFFKVENDGFGLGAQRRAIEKNDLPQVQAELAVYLQSLRSGFSPISSPPGRGGGEGDKQPDHGLVVLKNKIAANGDYNLSGERYREGTQRVSSYPHIRLEEIARVTSGNSAPQGEEYFAGGEAFFIRTSDVGAIHLSDNFAGSADKVNSKAIAEFHLELFPSGTILFPKSGASTFLNHRVVMAAPAYVSSHLACIICDESKALPKFVYHLLCRIDARDMTPDQAYPSLRLSEIGAIQIPLPPLDIQKEIVAEIEGYQNVIDGARAVLDNYRPHIPINPAWPMVALGEITRPEYGFTEKAAEEGDARFVRITDISQDGKLRVEGSKFITLTKDARESLLSNGDILVARTGATFGKTMIFEETYPAVFASFLIRLRFPKERVLPRYYWVFAQSALYWNQANALMTGGGQPQFNGNALVQVKFPLPPLATQQAIVAEIEAEQALVAANRELITRFEQKIHATLARIWGEERRVKHATT